MDQCAGRSESVWLASHFVGLNFQEFAQMEMIIAKLNDKNCDIFCEYMIILNGLIISLFL